MGKKKSIIYGFFKWPWLNFFLAVFFILSPLILSIFIQGNKGDFIHNFQIALPSVSRTLAFVFVILGFISLYQRSYTKSLYHYQVNLKELKEMDWEQFEALVSSYFIKTGFKISRKDNSVSASYRDFEANNEKYKIIIHCKYWNANNINSYPIKEIYKKIESKEANQLYVITCGNFTVSAKELAQGKNIELVNGYKLVEWKKFIES